MTDGNSAPHASAPWKARSLHHDAELFLRAPGCGSCIDREVCGGLNAATRLLDCMELCCGRPIKCTWVCRRNAQFKSQMQEIGGLRLDNIRVARSPAAPTLPPLVPLIYHGYRRATPLDVPAAAIKLAQMFDKRTGAPRFATRDALCRHFGIASSTQIIVSGVDQDPIIERWWGIGQRARLQVIDGMASLGISLVTVPNFTVSVNWPRYGDMAAMKRIGRVYAEIVNGGVAASLHVNGRTEMDFQRWVALLRRIEAISHLSYEFSTGAAFGARRARHIVWLTELARSAGRPLHLIVYGDSSVVRELRPAFASVTLIETSSFMKTMHRRAAVRLGNGELDWLPRTTAAKGDLSDLLCANVEEMRAYHILNIAD